MANAYYSLEDFIAQTRTTNFARANRFEVVFHPPTALGSKWTDDRLRRIGIMVEDTALPGRTMETARLRIHGLSEQRARAIDFFGEAINFTFYIDDTWNVKEFFEDWQELMVDGRSREVGFYKDYIGAIELRVLSVNDDLRHSVLIEEAWPRSYQLIQVAQGSNSVQRFVVAIAFKRWKTNVFATDDTSEAEASGSFDFASSTDALEQDIQEAADINSIIQASPTSPPPVFQKTKDDMNFKLPQIPDVLNIPAKILGRLGQVIPSIPTSIGGIPLPKIP